MSSMEAEIDFWQTPEIVEHLLTFMDATSILNLAHTHGLTVQILQNASFWTKLIRRTCPFGEEEEDRSLQDAIVQRKRKPVRILLELLELCQDQDQQPVENEESVEDQEEDSKHLELLKIICQRFPPIADGPGSWLHEPKSSLYVTLRYSNDFNDSLSCSVSPLGFLLLEEVEGSQRLDGDDVQRIQVSKVSKLEEPLLSVLSSRAASQEEQVTVLEIGTVHCNNDQDVIALSTLVGNSQQIGWVHLEVGEHVGLEGWAELARVVETLLVDDDDRWIDQFGFGFNISGSRKSMVEGRREHLRSIYEAILLGVEWGDYYWSWSVRSDGEEKVREWTYGEWERLEEILDMTEEEWCAEEL